MFYIFDFIGIKLPFIYSDFVGMVDQNLILMQRGIYVFIGLLSIFISILLFNRLPQSIWLRRIFIGSTLLLFLGSIFFVKKYLEIHYNHQKLRLRMITLNDQYLERPNITPLSCHIIFYHQDHKIKAEARYRITNKTAESLKQFYFCINPGLQIESVKYQDQSVGFSQVDHMIDIQVDNALVQGVIDSLSLSYAGTIEEAACYLDIDDHSMTQSFNIWLYQSPKKYSFLQERYVLLSPECQWYPRPALPGGTGFPNKLEINFIPFELEVYTKRDLIAISQGYMKSPNPGYYQFKTDFPVADISLVIGPYHMQSVRVDSIDYQLFSLAKHNYYIQYFSQIGDTLPEILGETIQDYEVRLNLESPFKRLSLIEVPIQYYAHPRIWTVAQEVVQPEQIWIQENAASLVAADFKQIKSSMERRLERSSQTYTEVESQITILKSFLNHTFFGKSMPRLRFGGPSVDYEPDYNVFPNYYSHITYLDVPGWQIFNSALEAYLYDRVNLSEESQPPWMVEGLTINERVSQALRTKSLAEHLSKREGNEILSELIKQKGSYIIKLLRNELGSQSFNTHLSNAIQTNWFNKFKLDSLIPVQYLDSTFDWDEYLKAWYYSCDLPAYSVFDVQLYKVIDRNRVRNQLLFKIGNSGITPGLIEVSFQYGRSGRGMPVSFSETEEPPRPFKIDEQEMKQIGILLDDEPRSLIIDFMIAANLPLVFSKQFEKAELNQRVTPIEGEVPLDESALLVSPNEIIVDNEEAGFEVFNPRYSSILRQLIHGEQREEKERVYDRFRWWRPPNQWTLIKNATFFGKYIHSAHYIRPGSGTKYALWKTEIENNGIYDIYTYMFSREGFWRGRGNRGDITFGDFNYTVYHAAGSDKVSLSADDALEGWNFLGSWYLTAGEAKVLLSDESNGRLVIADAIKWVKN